MVSSTKVKVGLLLGALVLAMPAYAEESSGRDGSWRTSLQGAPNLKTARKKVEQNPKDANALNDLGFALRQNQQLDESKKYLLEAIAIKPELAEAHCNLSVVYLDQKNLADALKEGKEAVKLNANHAIYRVVLGNAMSASGDLKGAEQEYRVAIHLKADYENAHYNLGRVLMESGSDNDARFALAEAVKLDPKDDRALALLEKLQMKGSTTPPASPKTPTADSKTGGKTAESK